MSTSVVRPIHFSAIKKFAESAAHYRHALTAPHEPTAAMRFGSVVDAIVFSRPYHVWTGERRGKSWSEFAAGRSGELIATADEQERADAAANALWSDPEATRYLTGRHQVAVEWSMFGVPWRTRGIDVLAADGSFVCDLKTTRSTQPDRFRRQADQLLYYAQLAAYRGAARSLGHEPDEYVLVGVESAPPHNVTVLRLTPAKMDQGERLLRLWTEQLLACEAADAWPGYTQSAVEYDVSAYEIEAEETD